MPYADLPTRVIRWVEAELGAKVDIVIPRIGGMSPAVAASVGATNGRRAFLKAVGTRLNPDTPTHFRMSSTQQAPPGLPNLPSFRARLGARCLKGASRRLGVLAT